VKRQRPELHGGLVGEEGVTQHETEHNPSLQRVQREILARHRVRVGGIQQLRRVGDEREHLGGAPLVGGQVASRIHIRQRQQRVRQRPRVRHKLLGQFLQRRIIFDDHLAEARKGGVRLVVRHLVGRVEEAQHRFAILNTGEQDHELDVDGDEVQVGAGQLKVDGDVEADLAGVDGGEQLAHVVLKAALWNRKLFFTVPVPTFEKLWFRFQLLKSYGSGSYC
jgi:hypothetical protein